MTTARPVIQLHTIQQWFAVDPGVRETIVQHIKLKDRLYKWLKERNERRLTPLQEPRWRPCHKCERRGWLLDEPRYPGIHPSQLPHECLLRIFNEMIAKEGRQKFEARQLLVFDLGHAVHAMFQSYGREGAWGPVYEPEAKVNGDLQQLAEDLMLEGSADADNILTIDDIPDSPYIYEVGIIHEYKSSNSNNFEKLTRPKPEHKTQAMLYSAARNRPITVYLYLNKDDSNIKDFPVQFDPVLWGNIEAKARRLRQYYDDYQKACLEGGTPFEDPPATVGYHCRDCQYSFNCGPYQAENARKGRR